MTDVCGKVFGSRRRFRELLVKAAKEARERSGSTEETVDVLCGFGVNGLAKCEHYEGDPMLFTTKHFDELSVNVLEFGEGVPREIEDAIISFLQIRDHMKMAVEDLDFQHHRILREKYGEHTCGLTYGKLAPRHLFTKALDEIKQ